MAQSPRSETTTRSPRRLVRAAAAVVTASMFAAPMLHGGVARAASAKRWITVWAPSSIGDVKTDVFAEEAFPTGDAVEQSVRTVVHVTSPGDLVRVRFTNRFGTGSLAIGGANVARRQAGPAVVLGTIVPLTFHGRPTVTLSAGTEMMSDPVPFALKSGDELAVTTYFPGAAQSFTFHPFGNAISYVSTRGGGNANGDPTGATFHAANLSVFWLDRVEQQSTDKSTVVALGDSLTDGFPVVPDQYQTWPDVLAARLSAAPVDQRKAVVNAGIAGNRLTLFCPECGQSGVKRAEHDALALSGVSTLILFEGTNDLCAGQSAAAIIDGLKNVAARARQRGIEVVGATITPRSDSCWTPAMEANRHTVNRWIRSTKAYDRYLDFDAIVRDPSTPTQLNATYDAGDHLHINVVGLQALAGSIDLAGLR